MTKIHYSKPSITALEVKYATDAATNGWGEKCYEYIHRFEKQFQDYLGVRFAIATSSCTGALHMGMSALGIGPGDEVILADTNWIAPAASITYLGAKPVLVDVLPDTWCIDPERTEAAITPRTKAIITIHLYGNLCEMDEFLAIGARHNISVIEDSAEAIGSVYHGKKAGSIGNFGTFSFHGTKTVTTGEGGMFVTDDEKLYDTVLTLSNHGRSKKQTKEFWPDMVGFKYKISNLQAAIGCAQIERIDDLVAAKRRIFKYYEAAFKKYPVRMNPEKKGTTNGYWMPTIVVDEGCDFDRDILLSSLKENNIDARVFFWPLSMLDGFESGPENEVSYSLYRRSFNLPSYHDLSEADMDHVIGQVLTYFSW